jgi:putative tryptophan/tyrosine transport system substrate-binding protein
MNRRSAGRALLIGPLAFGMASRAAVAQQTGKVSRIGYMSVPTRASVEQAVQAFERKLRELGWIDGQNLIIDYRWADGNVERLPELAADLVRQKVELIVAPAGTAALAAKKVTTSIPIVMMFPADPVDLGLVASLARPGGNVTGTTMAPGQAIFGKQLQILKEAVPRASRIALLSNPGEAGFDVQLKEVDTAARSLGIRMQHVEVRGPDDFASAFAAMARERAEALLGSNSSMLLAHGTRIAELAAKGRLPTMFHFRQMVEVGGLMAYGVNMVDFIGRAAVYVDKILKGAKPAELAVEQPTKFELVINLKTAKAIGVTISPSVLARVDELIQ